METLMFADEQMVMVDDENSMQRALYELYKITNSITTRHVEKPKVMAFLRKPQIDQKSS
jgi:hypothetical protein